MIGYVHLSAFNTDKESSISCQCSSFISRVLAFWILVTVQSDSTAVTAHRCSINLSNISQTEFHRVLHDWIRRCFSICSFPCFTSNASVAGVLWLKCFTNLPAAAMTLCKSRAKPLAYCKVCAKHGSDCQLTRVGSFAATIFLALSCTQATTRPASPQSSTDSFSLSAKFSAECLSEKFSVRRTADFTCQSSSM